MAGAVLADRIEMLNMLLEPLAASLGATFQPHRSGRRRRPGRNLSSRPPPDREFRMSEYDNAVDKERGLLRALRMVGARVEVAKADGAGDS